jgi:hypothetical protein
MSLEIQHCQQIIRKWISMGEQKVDGNDEQKVTHNLS